MKCLIAVCLAVILLSFSGCHQMFNMIIPRESEPPESIATEPPAPPYDCAQQSYQLADVTSDLKLLGRTYGEESGVICDHTASGIEFDAFVKGALQLVVDAAGDTYFTVYIDGVRLPDRYYANGVTEICIDNWDGVEELALHTFRIIKQTENTWSTAKLISMDFYGKLMGPAKDRDLYIEFIGDSLTCGYGNLWTQESEHPSKSSGIARYEDGTLAYPYLTAESLGADVSVVSCSGIGVYYGFMPMKMIDFYKMRSYARADQVEYDFANARIPDLIVINLGANDTSLLAPEGHFKTGVKEFIQYVGAAYGKKIPIVWVCGMGDSRTRGWVQDIFEELGGENEALYLVHIEGNADGGNNHPSLAAHKTAASKLSDYLRSIGFIAQ